METALQIFDNAEFGQLRTLMIDGKIYFVGKDVATILGYAVPRKAIRDHVDDEDKMIVDLNSVPKQNPITGATSEGWIKNEVTVINESGLYSLILSSKLPQAKTFKRWVTSKVIPAVMRYGVYATPDTAEKLLSDPDFAIRIFQALKDERAKVAELEEQNAVLALQNAELQPKACYYDTVLNCKDLVAVTTIAKDYGYSGQAFNRLLHDLHIQFKQGKIWLLYQNHAHKGWTATKTQTFCGADGGVHSRTHMYWTQKGRLALYELLKSRGILPKIERDAKVSA